jgi:FkbM family methyltransferase
MKRLPKGRSGIQIPRVEPRETGSESSKPAPSNNRNLPLGRIDRGVWATLNWLGSITRKSPSVKRRSLAIKQIFGLHEKKVRNLLKSIRGDCFYDVGANVGYYSLLLRHNFRRVYAVEPVPRNVKQLKRRLSYRFIKNVVVVQAALSDKNGVATFYVNSDKANILNNFSASSLFEKFEFRSSDHGPDRTYAGSPMSVETMTFDTLLSEPTADLVKIDVEGAEFLVLEGMRESFARQRVSNIMVELHDRNGKKELENILSRNFGRVFWVDAQHLYGCMEKSDCEEEHKALRNP